MPIAAASNTADAEFALARKLWEQSDVVRCETILRDLLAREPGHENATWLLAKLLQTQGQLDAASAMVFEWCRMHDFDPQHSLRGAEFIQQCHRQGLADKLCEDTLARHPQALSQLYYYCCLTARTRQHRS